MMVLMDSWLEYTVTQPAVVKVSGCAVHTPSKVEIQKPLDLERIQRSSLDPPEVQIVIISQMNFSELDLEQHLKSK